MTELEAAIVTKRHLLAALDNWPNVPALNPAYTTVLRAVDDLDRHIGRATDPLTPRVVERPEREHPSD